MNKLRWVMDGPTFWELDVSTPLTMDAVARPSAHEGPLPLGLSRSTRLSRPKQLDFLHKFMAAPFVPSYCGAFGLSLQRALTLPLGNDWFTTLLGQFNLQKFAASVKKAKSSDPFWLQVIGKHLSDKSFYAFGFCSEYLITSDDKLLVAYEECGDTRVARKKAVFRHEFPHHNLTLEAVSPGLFIDKDGRYWDVPVSVAADLASVPSDSGSSYHFSLQHVTGSAKQVDRKESTSIPADLLPGLYLKSAFSLKRNIDLWRSQAKKLKLVQPFDIFLSSPHVSATGVIGAVATALVGDNALRSQGDGEKKSYKHFNLHASAIKLAFLGDLFASLSFSAQHGNFQKMFLDLTECQVRFDVPSGTRFLSAAACVAKNLYKSQQPPIEAVQAVCPNIAVSFQQQVIVSARKPEFFQMSQPMYEVVTEEGLMRPCFKGRTGGLYSGGSALMVESSLGVQGDEILYVGDHIYTDVSQSKVHLRWRTALISRELEEEYTALIRSRAHRSSLIELINQKEVVGDLFNQLRLALQRRTKDRPAQTLAATKMDDQELTESMRKLLIVMQRLDDKIAPMMESDGELFNRRWGFLSRAGLWDKSHLMRQIEKYADIYTSRVSNFLHYTPFMYFRSQEQNLAHDSYSSYCDVADEQ